VVFLTKIIEILGRFDSLISDLWVSLEGDIRSRCKRTLSWMGRCWNVITGLSRRLWSICGRPLTGIIALMVGVISLAASLIEISNYLGKDIPAPIYENRRLVKIALVLNGDHSYTRDIEMGIRSGLETGLANSPYEPLVETAVGAARESGDEENRKIFQDVISRLPDGSADYLVTVGTGVSRFAYREYLGKIPIIFAGVTDPVASGLVRTDEADPHRGAIAGVDYGLSHIERVKLFAEFFPGKKFGYIYHPDYNSDVVVKDKLARELTNLKGIEVVFIVVNEPHLTPDQEQLADIFFGHYYVQWNLKFFLAGARKPFRGGTNPDNLKRGSMMVIGNDDDKNIGKIVANKILLPNLLQGKPLHGIAIQRYKNMKIGLNLKMFKKYDIAVPISLRGKAKIIE
jgi:ABC-type uncharacterized transport system substrate-binding protein